MIDHDVGQGTRWAVAVDLGGTWIRTAAVSDTGAIGPLGRRETAAGRPHADILGDVLALIEEAAGHVAAESGPISGVGVGIATVLDDEGRTVPCPTLPALGNLDLRDLIGSRTRLPVAVANDASCFALGEAWMGAGRECSHLCGLTLGTGIGLGIVIDGRIYSGSHGFAGEIWRTPTGDGCLEDHVSGRAIERQYRSLSGMKRPCAQIADLAAAGDAAALAAFVEFGRWLGATVAFLVNALDPDVVVLGGAIALSFDLFRRPVEDALAKTTSPGRARLERSSLGDSAALLGAAKLLWDRLEGDEGPTARGSREGETG